MAQSTSAGNVQSTNARRRTAIPPRPQRPLNILKFLKNTIGKELTRLSFPVEFNEPLSMLQRVLECLEFASILDRAARENDGHLQAALVALYHAASFMRISDRIKKPFNPLLGETYELDLWNEPEGYRAIVEQVEHHPPVTAIHVESRHGWQLQTTVAATSMFRLAKMAVEISSAGGSVITFKNNNRSYSLSRPHTSLSLLSKSPTLTVSGPTSVRVLRENAAFMSRLGASNMQHSPGECDMVAGMHFGAVRSGIFSSGNRYELSGKTVGDERYKLRSDDCTQYCEVFDSQSGETVERADRSLAAGEESRLQNTHLMAHFQVFLNQPMDGSICATDVRLRPDQRLMEMGDYDSAESVKSHLEQKQRARRSAKRPITEMWFTKNPACLERNATQLVPDWVLQRDYFQMKEQGWNDNRYGVDFQARGRSLFGFLDAVEKYDENIRVNADVNNNTTDCVNEQTLSSTSFTKSSTALSDETSLQLVQSIEKYCDDNQYRS